MTLSPSDDVEARAAVKAAYAYEGPVYIRLGRLATPVFHDAERYTFQIGKGEQLTDGNPGIRHYGQERFPDDRTYFGACHIPLEFIGRENDFHCFTMLSQECR